MQAALLGVDHFRDTAALLHDLADLDMFADVQVDGDQLVEMAPMLEPSGVRVLIDHCGRPDPTAGLSQPGFRRLLDLASSGRYFVKISGLVKCSAADLSVGGFLAVRAGAARGVHARPVHVGIGLAVPAGPGADRLRTRSRPCRATDPRSRSTVERCCGTPPCGSSALTRRAHNGMTSAATRDTSAWQVGEGPSRREAP